MKKYVTLGEVCKLNMGQSPDSSTYNDNGEGIPFYQGNADFGEIHPITAHWCTSPTKLAEDGDILISVRAPIGALNIATEKCCIGRGLAAITVDSENVIRDYIRYMLKSRVTMLQAMGTGSTFKAINKNVLNDMQFLMPTLEEQNQIALNLIKIDTVIHICTDLMNKLDMIVKSRFIEMFNTGEYTTVKLKSVCSKITDGTHKTPNYLPEGITFISAKNIINGELDFSDVKYISETEYNEIQKRCQTEIHDILLSKSGSLGSPTILRTDKPLGLFESLAIIKYDRRIMLPEFLCEQLKTDDIQRQFKIGTKGVAIKHLHLNVIGDIDVVVPPLALQQQFADFVEQTDKSKFIVDNIKKIIRRVRIYDQL